MHQEFILPHSATVLPPAAACAPLSAFFESHRQLRSLTSAQRRELLIHALVTSRMLESCALFSSGKDALLQLFLSLAKVSTKRLVAVAAYTCPDVAAAAIRAGFTVVPIDTAAVDDSTPFGMSNDALNSLLHTQITDPASTGRQGLAAVVLSNLYGLPEAPSTLLRHLSEQDELLLIDDACQSAFSRRGLQYVGATTGAVGVLSFGRGKALGGIGGGALLLAEKGVFEFEEDGRTQKFPIAGSSTDSLAQRVWRQLCAPQDDGLQHLGNQSLYLRESSSDSVIQSVRALKDWTHSAVQWGFSSPTWYRLPASIPWLGLGETHCDLDFPVGAMSDLQIVHAITQLRRETPVSNQLHQNSQRWQQVLSKFPLIQPFADFSGEHVTCTRYPIIFERIEDRASFLRESHEAGLGVSGSYPAPLQAFSALHSGLQQQPTLNAERLARTLVTLPIHSYVEPTHIEKTLSILKRIFS